MSFQGDVAGIGLGELLQGLGRGGRDGVLTLRGHRLAATLGWKSGLLYMLAHPDEDDELWSKRATMAFADFQDDGLEMMRRRTIARAQRVENFYAMLDAPNLHFRFEPGTLPTNPSEPVGESISLEAEEFDEAPEASPEDRWGPGWTVEYLLLEHARICDEIKTGPGSQVSDTDIPLALAPEDHPNEIRDFLKCCDGSSTTQEIADRLGWPLSQGRSILGEHIQAGTVRLFDVRELLAGAQREMVLGRVGRAADRMRGWIKRSPVGPMAPDDAELLIDAWHKKQLEPVLHRLDATTGRRILRKLEHFDKYADEMHGLWRAQREAHTDDAITGLHELALRMSEAGTPDGRAFKDLLRIARNFQDAGFLGRTRTLLRLAASHLPERPQTRVEIGRRMLEAGLTDEGIRWLLDTAAELTASDPEGAMFPLRAVMRDKPDHPEAKALIERARDRISMRKRQRWSLMVGLSLGLVISLVAFVRYRTYREIEFWIREAEAVGNPLTVLSMLEEKFGADPPQRIVELRNMVLQRKKGLDTLAYKEWMKTYEAAEDACRFGDPLDGLLRTLELPVHPDIPTPGKAWPEPPQLFGLLSANLEQRSIEVDVSEDAVLEELKPEELLIDLMHEVLETLPPETMRNEAHPFRFRVVQLLQEVMERRGQRAERREEMLSEEKELRQDILLATARAHERAGALERSLLSYEELLASDEELANIKELKREISSVRAHWRAVKTALRLADEGRHAEAATTLRDVCPRPSEHLLPFHVDSLPRGAKVKLPNGRERPTPFVTKAGVGEKLELVFKHKGFRNRTIELIDPQDLIVHLNRFPERTWESSHRIEAIPVRAGDDHIVADRYGRVQRIDADSEALWQVELGTLGGIARTPVFLPQKPGWLLLVSEDGLAWLIHAEDGEHKGPQKLSGFPVDGPVLGPQGVRVLFDNGQIGTWRSDLEPRYVAAEENAKRLEVSTVVPESVLHARDILMVEDVLRSPWNSWTVDIQETDYRIVNENGMGFTAERGGQWIFIAWEAPKTFTPQGRLWVSDEKGLRSYLPDMDLLIDLSRDE